MRDSTPLSYSIDDRNRLISVNEVWAKEAEDSATPGLSSPAILGRRLWDLIADPTIAHFFDLLFSRLRTGQTPRVTYSFRCDTPARRRLIQLSIVPTADQGLRFTTSVLATQERPPVALLDARQPRSGELLRMCSWCKRVPTANGSWREIEEAVPELDALDHGPLPAISHGICPDCQARMQTLLEEPAQGGTGATSFGRWDSV
jgi:hypothetical protein